jgi:acetylornithine/N-succinyldiaminopimelate aminotransferase
VKPDPAWISALRKRCDETGALLVLDEIQVGFGRTGSLWGFEQYGVVPDILMLGKALGAGMPLGAFIASQELMGQLTHDPVLGHITTFGGHPVSCAAGLAGLEALLDEGLVDSVPIKEALFHAELKHPRIRAVRSAGLLMALQFEDDETCRSVMRYALSKGLLTDWFLFAPHCLRIAPPLVISADQIRRACAIILEACDQA